MGPKISKKGSKGGDLLANLLKIPSQASVMAAKKSSLFAVASPAEFRMTPDDTS